MDPILSPSKKARPNTPDLDQLGDLDEDQLNRYYPSMAETNMMLQRKPKYPGRYYGYTAVPRTQTTFKDYGPSWGSANPEQRKKRLSDFYIGAGRYRKRRRYGGRGMYYGQGNYFSRMMHRQMNRTLAGKTPLGHLGKKIGRNLLGRVEGAVLGQGMYDLNGDAPASNNLVAGGGLSVPTFASSQDETGALTIQHSEYIKDIYGLPWSGGSITDTFKNDSLHLNPGIARNFPWLSQIACNYEEYEFKQLMFCFKTRVGDNLTTTDGQVGTIMMFTDYNATDKARKTKQEMLQAYGTSVAKITDNDVLHGIECDPSKIKGDAHKFIRVGSSDQDLHDFDWGLFQIAVDNTPETLSNKVIGELYVSYTIVLRKPRLFATLGLAIQQDQFLVPNITTDASGNITTHNVATATNNSLGCSLVADSIAGADVSHRLIFPSSLSGSIELMILLDAGGSGAAGYVRLAGIGGNVTLSKDLALGSTVGPPATGALDDSDPSSGAGQVGHAATNAAQVTVAHFNVEMASKDVDNIVIITVRNSTASTNMGALFLVRRYNDMESSDPPQFKLSDGTPVPQYQY